MSRSLNSQELIETIKRRAFLPEDQVTFSDADLLEIATEEIMISLAPKVLVLHEDYYLFEEEVDIIADTPNYKIPYRATGDKLRDVTYKDTNRNELELVRIPAENLPDYQGSVNSVDYRYYYLRSDEVVLIPGVGSSPSGSLLFRYYISPNALVMPDRAATISAIDRTLGIITFDDVSPDNFSATILYDFIQAKSPHKIINYDIAVTAANNVLGTITLDPDSIPAGLNVGDYVLQAEETIFPQIPTELHPVLAQYVAIACLEAMGDANGLTIAERKLKKMEEGLDTLLDNRVEGSPAKAVNRNSILSNTVHSRSRGYFRRRGGI